MIYVIIGVICLIIATIIAFILSYRDGKYKVHNPSLRVVYSEDEEDESVNKLFEELDLRVCNFDENDLNI